MLSQAFGEQALKGMEGVMLLHVRQLCEVLGGKGEGKEGGKWNMADWFSYLSYDVMGELCFGKSYDMLVNSARRSVIGLVDRAAFRHYVVSSAEAPSLLYVAEEDLIICSAVSGFPSTSGTSTNSSSDASPAIAGPS